MRTIMLLFNVTVFMSVSQILNNVKILENALKHNVKVKLLSQIHI